MQQMTARGMFALATEEGFVPAPYKDLAGRHTVYFGHTAMAGAPDPAKMSPSFPPDWSAHVAPAFALLDKDLDKYEAEVSAVLGPLAPQEFDGWVMWHYNTGAIRQTNAVKLWKAGRRGEAVAKLREWNKVTINGKKTESAALKKRRKIESDMILLNQYLPKGATIPVWPTDGNRRVIWHKMGAITFDEALNFMGRSAKTPPSSTGKVVATGLAAAIITALATSYEAIVQLWEKLPW